MLFHLSHQAAANSDGEELHPSEWTKLMRPLEFEKSDCSARFWSTNQPFNRSYWRSVNGIQEALSAMYFGVIKATRSMPLASRDNHASSPSSEVRASKRRLFSPDHSITTGFLNCLCMFSASCCGETEPGKPEKTAAAMNTSILRLPVS